MNYFYAGQTFAHDGIQYRVLEGTRCKGDLVLEFFLNGWHRPKIAHTLILAAFKHQVEENNYGPEGQIKRAEGGRYLLKSIERACVGGWQLEAETIQQERLKAQRRRTEENMQMHLLDERGLK